MRTTGWLVVATNKLTPLTYLAKDRVFNERTHQDNDGRLGLALNEGFSGVSHQLCSVCVLAPGIRAILYVSYDLRLTKKISSENFVPHIDVVLLYY